MLLQSEEGLVQARRRRSYAFKGTAEIPTMDVIGSKGASHTLLHGLGSPVRRNNSLSGIL